MSRPGAVLLLMLVVIATALPAGEEAKGFRPQAGEFPPAGVGVYYAGELVEIDHVNRRGAIRLDGDGVEHRYHAAPSHRFALLPYATIRYRGACADLRDVPLGTRVHGWFVLAPEGDTSIPPPTREKQFVPPETHALSLEDDPSFHLRQQQAWRIQAIDIGKKTLTVALTGPQQPADKDRARTVTIDASSRIWRGRTMGGLTDLAQDAQVQLAFGWHPEWQHGKLHVTDAWLDDEALALAAEVQRQIHLRHRHHRWQPGWVEHVEHLEKGSGIVTVMLFAGSDPQLYDEIRAHRDGYDIAVADTTLRTWWQDHDKKGGARVALEEVPDPPPGSSGIRLKIRCWELLEGYRPGRIVRVRPYSWPNSKLPPEERIKNADDR